MSRWSRWTRTLLAVALVLATAVPALAQDRTAPPTESDSPFTIHLKSGSFAPTPGVESELVEKSAALPGTWVGLIQLQEIPDEALRAEFAARGIELLSYLPEKTWIASIDIAPAAVASLADVRWVGRLLPQDKIDPETAVRFTGPTGMVYKDGQSLAIAVAVETVPGAGDKVADALAARGATVVERDDQLDLLVVEVSADQVLALTRIEQVLWVEVQPIKVPFNDLSRIRTRAEEVQAAPYNLDGSGVQLGVWDEGRIHTHVDFGTRLNMVDLGSPFSNHATHVTGTMAGDGSLSAAFSLPAGFLRGMAPAADIVGYDFAGATDVEHNVAINTWGIDLSQNSWGFAIEQALPFNNCALYGNYVTLSRNYDRIVTGLYGTRIPVVFANGNERNDGDCGMSAVPPFLNYSVVPPPATAKNVISVGAINGDDGAMTTFSSWGPVDDGRIKPEIVAPGCNVAGLQNLPGTVSTWNNGSDTYAAICGTSMAAPAVSGNIGLLLERYRDVCPAGGTDPLPSTIKALLVHGAVDLDDASTFLNAGPDYASGYGSMDIKESIDLLPFHVEDDVAQGVTDTYQIVVTQQDDLKVTLVWDDTAATAGAAVTLVNNLDLELMDPLGGIHRPWILNPAIPANAATTGVDSRNVVEQVVVGSIPAALAGTWTIRVIGTTVPSGPQGYSLVSQHLTQTGCNGAPAGDAWIMDKDLPLTPVDTGAEPNPDLGPMWISNQIWVRNAADSGTVHQNPDFGQENFIYARVRNNGATTLDTVRAIVYYADASTGLSWPGQWHLAGSSTVIGLGPGGSVVIDPVAWDPPGQGHYCLVVRLLTPQDPMTFTEGPSINYNVRYNNNIAWRNVNVVDFLPNSEGGFTVISRNVLEEEAEIELVLDMSRDGRGRTLLDTGVELQLEIDEKSLHLLEERGFKFDGQGIERVDDRTLVVTSPTAVLGPWTLGGGQEVHFEVIWTSPRTLVPLQKPYILDVNQNFGRTFAPVANFARDAQDAKVTLQNSPDDPNVGGIRYEITVHEK